MNIVLFLFLIILFFILYPLFNYNKVNYDIKLNCSINSKLEIKDKKNGYIVVNNILNENCRKKIVDLYLEKARKNKDLNMDLNFSFYSNKTFLNQLTKIVGKQIFNVNSLDLQRCWLRYYFAGMKAQFYENYHHDIKRYNDKIKQYRLVIPIFDNSNCIISINGKEIAFKQNMGIFLEANNCLHKVNFSKGERFVLIMDFISKDCDTLFNHYSCRNMYGYINWVQDFIWRIISEKYYKLMNV